MLEEYKLISLMLTTVEMEIVKSVVAALDPFKVATNFRCSRKCNLASAEDIVRFTASKLEENVDDLSSRLLESLIFRYNDRTNSTLVSQVKFFQNPDTSSSDLNYRMPGRSILVRNAKSLHQRFLIHEDPSSSSVDEPSSDQAPAGNIDIAAQL